MPDGTQTVRIGDRESDIDDRLIEPRNSGQPRFVRAAWDRKLTDPPEQHLGSAAEAVPMVGTMMVTVPSKPGRRERQAT